MILPSLEIETAPNPTHAIIWMHGLGADGHDFEPIVPELVGALTQAGVRLTRVDPHEPTLEELYFAVRKERRDLGAEDLL